MALGCLMASWTLRNSLEAAKSSSDKPAHGLEKAFVDSTPREAYQRYRRHCSELERMALPFSEWLQRISLERAI